nr:NAD(P)-dependent oxidoreductase [Desulfitibacter alkalitolerans]
MEEINMKFGFIGLGNMGGGLARNLIRAGKETVVYDLKQEAIDNVLKVGTTGRASKDINEIHDADVIFTSLPLPKHVESVMLGEDGLLSKMKKGSVYIDVSTIDPQTARKLADEAEQRGIGFLECPLGKGPVQAEEGTEPIFAGGQKEVFDKVKDILEIVGKPVYCGDVEASAAVKIISNLIGMANVAVFAEGMRLGEKAGIDSKLLLELLLDTGANSFQLQVRGPWIVNNDFKNRFAVDLALKDIRLGKEMSEAWGKDYKLFKQAVDYFKQASEAGYGSEDCCAVYKVID